MEIGKQVLIFDDFLYYLRRQGFAIGVDHHLRLQEMLNKLGADCEPVDLKYLLCPIFATSEKQQQQFYRAFDSYFIPLVVAAKTTKVTVTAEKSPFIKPGKKKTAEFLEEAVNPPKWPFILVGVLLVILVIVFILLLGERPEKKNQIEINTTQVQTKSGTTLEDENKNKTELETEKPEWVKELYSLFQKYRYLFRWVGLLAPFITLLLIELYKYNRRRVVLVRQRGKKPPFIWPLKIESPGIILIKNDRFHEAAHFLRKRMASDILCLDLEKTISSTIIEAGYPKFRYKYLTRPPEYLILLDMPSYQDHYAQLWDSLVTALGGEGVYVTRYFYEKDPRVCFKQPDGQREYLFDLKNRYCDHRLIIFGDGDELLDLLTGEIASWTVLFQTWRERALLTTRSPREWGRQEIALAGEFVLVPSTLQGLCSLKHHWELPKEPGIKKWKDDGAIPPHLKPGREEELVEDLRNYLGIDTFQWLCACAVYSELHWDLTLYLGTLPCMPDNLVSEENILRLLRLPWFRTGSMPDELRWALITRLDSYKSRAIRNAIVDLLKQNQPPKGSFAYDSYRLNLLVQQCMLSKEDQQKRKAISRTLKNIDEKSIVQDYTLVRFLEMTSGTPMHFVLPKKLRKIFFTKGISFFGFNTGIRMALAIIIAVNSFLLFKDPNLSFKTLFIQAVADLIVLLAVTLTFYFKEYYRDKLTQITIEMPPKKLLAIEKARRISQNEKGYWEANYDDGIVMTYIPPGNFIMGSDNGDTDEMPRHEVYLDGYWMGKYEVTVRQYLQFVKDTNYYLPEDCFPESLEKENYPVVGISWDEANAYCDWLSNKIGLNFKLPTEAQWEKAARGTDSRIYPWGDKEPDMTLVNFGSEFDKITPVGSYPDGASPYGLLDMVGNAWEWCSDWYDWKYHKSTPSKNPTGPKNGFFRVTRGGGLVFTAWSLHCTERYINVPYRRNNLVGFRLCQEID